ncbi:MAG: prepilin-type N-terminal cleavage/methylation domain-containing protein [Myxococcales bacterium]|nr:prepilin-type N-terminal cleavage/methylation domain-containing protein [Myxococcales bacterium]
MTHRLQRPVRAGFTLIEVMIASAILGLSLVVMFGFHSQAVRANMNAHRMTDCTYLAQSHLEQLLAEDWTRESTQPDLGDLGGTDPATLGIIDSLEHVGSTVNAANDVDISHGPIIYEVSWDVEGLGGSDPSGDDDWLRLRVRCKYPDAQFGTHHAATVSSYRFRDS